MKKCFSWIFTVTILVLCLSISVGTVVFGPSAAGANEQLALMPEVKDKDGNWNENYLSDILVWFSDHFILRQELISAHNYLSANLLNTAGSDGVVLGKDGWLFYAETLADYTGSDPMTDRELFAAANNLALMAEFTQSTGRDFLFVSAPNKSTIYSQYMPAMEKAPQQDIYKLFALLDDMNVPYVDLYSAFIQEGEQVYFKHDSHWNSKGAAIGADLINQGFGVDSNYADDDFSEKIPHTGDLYEMLYPAFTDSEEDVVYGQELVFDYTSKATKPDSITLTTQGRGQTNLLAYRDSFGNLLYPYLADSYGTARFSRSANYDLTLESDHVMIELVQRNLRYLTTNLPVIQSPVRQITIPEEFSGVASAEIVKGKAPEGYVLVKGAMTEETDADTCVYVVCGGVAYEAFQFPGEKLEFAVYVPEGQAPEQVVYTVSGSFKMLTVQ